MLAAKPNREIAIGAEELAENCYVAYFDRIFGKRDPVFAEYRLPAMALPPPLQVLRVRPCRPNCSVRLSCQGGYNSDLFQAQLVGFDRAISIYGS